MVGKGKWTQTRPEETSMQMVFPFALWGAAAYFRARFHTSPLHDPPCSSFSAAIVELSCSP